MRAATRRIDHHVIDTIGCQILPAQPSVLLTLVDNSGVMMKCPAATSRRNPDSPTGIGEQGRRKMGFLREQAIRHAAAQDTDRSPGLLGRFQQLGDRRSGTQSRSRWKIPGTGE